MIDKFEEPLGPQGRLFEQELHQDLHQFLQSMKEIDARLPECPDVEEKWEQIAKAYIPVCINSTCLEPLCSSSTSEAAKPSGTGWAIT